MKVIQIVLLASFALYGALAVAEYKSGKPGDEFRKAAADYEDNASKAVKEATHTKGQAIGHYLELSGIYREMAGIKHDAAAKADLGRWDDISWDHYHQLEKRRDVLMNKVDWAHARSQKAQKHKQKYSNKKHKKSSDHGFKSAGDQYMNQARKAWEKSTNASGESKQAYQAISNVYEEMGKIKYAAAEAAQQGKDYDWSRYHELEGKRNRLKSRLKH